MPLYFTEIYHFIGGSLYFSPTNFAENLKVSLSRNRILFNLKEILVNAWSLQNYSLQMVSKMSYVPLNAENSMQSVKKSKFYFAVSLLFRWKDLVGWLFLV